MKNIYYLFAFLCAFSFNVLADTTEEAAKLLDNNQADQALEILKTLDSDSANVNYLLAKSYLYKNDLTNSVKYAEIALKKDPKVSNHQLVYAQAQGLVLANGKGGVFKKLGTVKKVRRAFESAVKLDPSNIEARSGLMQFYTMAPGIAGGSKKKALKQAQAVFELDKEQGYPLLAQAYQANKNEKKTREIITKWNVDYPESWGAVYSLSQVELNDKNYSEAYETLSSWLTKKPEHMSASYQLGRMSAISGKYLDEGEASLQKFIQNTSDNSSPPLYAAHWRLGLIYQHKNKLEQAKEQVTLGLALKPDYKELLELKKTLQ